MAFTNLFDWLQSVFIRGDAYHFAASGDLITPLVVGIAVGYIRFLRRESRSDEPRGEDTDRRE